MLTVKQMERWWRAGMNQRLVQEIVSQRPEYSDRLAFATTDKYAVAAWVVVRLEELSQSHLPFCQEMLRVILAGQQADGSWGEPVVTALCLRALLCSGGKGRAIDAALDHLSLLQQNTGIWPVAAIRRLPEDPFASAFILICLSEFSPFREAVRIEDAIAWFHEHEDLLDVPTAKLWAMAWRRWLTSEIRTVRRDRNIDFMS